MLLGLLYTLCVIPALAQGDQIHEHEVEAELGSTISLPCEASLGNEDFFYRSWSRGERTMLHTNVTKLFFQIQGSSPDRAPGARSDMAVDDPVFNLTITNVKKEDTSPFTCCIRKNQKYVYSYVYVFIKTEDSTHSTTSNTPTSNTPINNTAFIVGLTSGVVVLALLVTSIAVYRKKTSGGLTRLSGQDSTEAFSLVEDTGSLNVKVNGTEKQTKHKLTGKQDRKKKKTGGTNIKHNKNKAE